MPNLFYLLGLWILTVTYAIFPPNNKKDKQKTKYLYAFLNKFYDEFSKITFFDLFT